MLHLTTLVRLQGVEWICETSKACAVSGMFWRTAILAMLERGRIALWGSIYLTDTSSKPRYIFFNSIQMLSSLKKKCKSFSAFFETDLNHSGFFHIPRPGYLSNTKPIESDFRVIDNTFIVTR